VLLEVVVLVLLGIPVPICLWPVLIRLLLVAGDLAEQIQPLLVVMAQTHHLILLRPPEVVMAEVISLRVLLEGLGEAELLPHQVQQELQAEIMVEMAIPNLASMATITNLVVAAEELAE
jgi:hypothetical protein